MSNCSRCKKKIYSNAILDNNNVDNDFCFDVCVNAPCGDPKYLTVLAPVVYDEIGVNLCRPISIATAIAANPTASYATAEVVDINFTAAGGATTTVDQINSRPNCYEVTLTNLTIDFVVKLYDCCKQLLATESVTGVTYLPSDPTNPYLDPETNPSSVTMDLFAPYGVSYTNGNVATPELNVIGFSSTNNSLKQGLNLMAIPRVLDFDRAANQITVGLTTIVKVVYFSQYNLCHNGKAIVSKGSLTSPQDSICQEFVKGSLLDRGIKPLEPFNPFDKKEDCKSCTDPTDCDCMAGD